MSTNHTPQLLNERIILVTGAAEGLGRAVALACAKHGATVVLMDFEDTDLEGTYDAIEANGGPQPANLLLDLAKADSLLCEGAAFTLGNEFGRLDGLVHCAAFAPYLSRIDDYDPGDWAQVIQVNLSVPFMLTQACLPLLRAAPEASIVFTADRVGRRGLAYWGAYTAAKFGIEGLVQTLAEETRDSSAIRVNSFDPGIVRTAMRAALYPAEDPYIHPDPSSVTPGYIYLLGAESRGVTGQALSAATLLDSGAAS